MIVVFYVFISAAILTMFAGLAMGLRLRRVVTGGIIGRVVNILLALILMFTCGYLVAPFLPYLPPETALILAAVVFFFGAVYVVLVLWLIQRLIQKVLATLEID